ncbi:hypothetical protein HMPREF0758_4479 [Serratia odorifera DSM 4582]|uniref:Uncharacterized protein n=1 Tax=Serratia odorifera DSM 4582 TaxID=667129 RepID=D4E8H9_SEROD|nr:hypothetical protein HMPREF0758_4479 [Serratia odorifera DSM 4582]
MLTSTEYLCNLCELKFITAQRDNKRIAQHIVLHARWLVLSRTV